MSKVYVSHHNHSAFSTLDSLQTPDDIARTAKSRGLDACSLTDHGTLAGYIQFKNACKKYAIKPIFGVEAYFVDNVTHVGKINEELDATEIAIKKVEKDNKHEKEQLEEKQKQLKELRAEARKYNHLILLARNWDGVKSLIRIHNDALIDGFYYKPRCDWSILEKHIIPGIIIGTTACLGGRISKLILKEDMNAAKEAIEKFKKLFGEGNFYLELQLNELKMQKDVNDGLIKLSESTKTPLCITSDSHFSDPGQHKTRQLFRQLDKEADLVVFDDQLTDLYIKNEDMLLESWKQYMPEYPLDILAEAIRNTRKIADSVEEFEFDSSLKFPELPIVGMSQEKFLTAKAYEGLEHRGLVDNPQYVQQLKKEIGVITRLGFSSYFNIVADLVNHEKEHQHVGPARGSCGGSLLAYALGITNINPIRYGLFFERFLSEEKGVYAPSFGLHLDDIELDKGKILEVCQC